MDCNRIIEYLRDWAKWLHNLYHSEEKCKECGRKNK